MDIGLSHQGLAVIINLIITKLLLNPSYEPYSVGLPVKGRNLAIESAFLGHGIGQLVGRYKKKAAGGWEK